MALEDLDVLELEERARAMGELIDACVSWGVAVNRASYFLFWLTIGFGSYDAIGGKSIWPTVIAYVCCFVTCFIMDKFWEMIARAAARRMRMYVDRREELFHESRRARRDNP